MEQSNVRNTGDVCWRGTFAIIAQVGSLVSTDVVFRMLNFKQL